MRLTTESRYNPGMKTNLLTSPRCHHGFRNVVLGATAAFAVFAAIASHAAVVSVPYKGPRQIEEFEARGIEILAFTKHGIDLQAEGANLDFLRTRPYPVSVTELDPHAHTTFAIDANLGIYHTYSETESTLTALQAAYPAIAKKTVLGLSLEGRNISSLKVSDNVAVDESEPEILYMGNHHARELMSVEIPLRFAEYILAKYGVDATITNSINTREIFFVPMVNPDGQHWVQLHHTGSSNNWWRKNRRPNAGGSIGVDVNRNYGYQWGFDNVGSSPTPTSEVYRGTAAFSEPETQVIRDFVNSRQFKSWFSYHSYGELLLYGWGYYYGYTPDHEVYAAFADTLAYGNGYLAGNPATGAIYITNGASDDWGYAGTGHSKIFAFTPEVNSAAQGGFGPPESVIQPTFNLLLPMNRRLLQWGDNPYRVVGPYTPNQYAVQAPYSNGINRVSWNANIGSDPNPVVSYEVEGCLNPTQFIDACTPALTGWTANGFGYSPAGGLSGGGYDSGSGDGLANTLMMTRPFTVNAATDTLRFSVTYDIEQDYDYGYVDVSTNGGVTWAPIQGNITTAFNPFGSNRGHGFTGTSVGWVNAIFPLTAFAGQEIMIRLAYFTDGAVQGLGYFVDNINFVVSCGSVSIVASAVTDTLYDHVPSSAGTWRYRVRARDAESQVSHWSNARDRVVSTLTAVDAPRVFRTDLGANYPNPFNPETQIPFVVGGGVETGTVRVELAIFSVTGSRVATLVNESRPPGTYVSRWNGLDAKGQPSPTGIYFARLTVDGAASRVRKLLLLK